MAATNNVESTHVYSVRVKTRQQCGPAYCQLKECVTDDSELLATISKPSVMTTNKIFITFILPAI